MAQYSTVNVQYAIPTILINGEDIPCGVGYQPKLPGIIFELLKFLQPRPETPPGTMKTIKIQTMYRESEVQTDPFNADIIEPENKDLEILTLGYLSWNNGLPAGMHEIEMIERARQRRAWEKAVPEPVSEETVKIRRMILEAIELNEWSFREEEIEFLNGMRIELAEKMMSEKFRVDKNNLEKRIEKLRVIKTKERDEKLQKARKLHNRQLRKLMIRRNNVDKKFHYWNIVEELEDRTSELYGPQMRFGENPKRRHELIQPDCRFWNIFNELEVLGHKMSDIPRIKNKTYNFQKPTMASLPKSKYLCIHETKWTDEVLKNSYEELRTLRLGQVESIITKACRFKQKIPPPSVKPETPRIEGIPEQEEDIFQMSLFLQKNIKGRAVQATMFEGRVRCQELIEEIKSTHVLEKYLDDFKLEKRERIYKAQRQREVDSLKETKKQEIFKSLEGKTNGDMLDFLSKELLRLQNERQTHAFALLATRERNMREAAEAGRRQTEEQRRREHDEMFKQMVKMQQNTVDKYLEDVIMESNNWIAEREAREYIHNIARKVDQAAYDAHLRHKEIEEEELVADLVHNYALPEAKKRILRERIQKRQKNYLRVCHDEVYTNIEHLVQGTRTPRGTLVSLPSKTAPPKAPVKVLKFRPSRTVPILKKDEDSDMSLGFLVPNKEQVAPQHKSMYKLDLNWTSGFSNENVIIP